MPQETRIGQKNNGTETVSVLCKLPQGMQLQLYERHENVVEVTQGGTQKVTKFLPYDNPVIINGCGREQNAAPRHRTVGGYAVTEGVSKDFWEKWMAQTGRYLPAVKNNLIIALPNITRAVEVAKDHRKVRSGLERVDPRNIPVLDPRFKIKMDEDTPTEVKEALAAAEEFPEE